MILVYDVETTGKADFKKPAADPCQPHIMQLAMLLMDEEGRYVSEVNFIIKPEGYTAEDVDPEAVAIHKISFEKAMECGVPRVIAMAVFSNLSKLAKEAAAFNDDFDSKLIDATFHRIDKPSPFLRPELKRFCIMKAMTNVCQLPNKFRRGEFKWPSLQEAYNKVTGDFVFGAHNALADTRAAAVVRHWLRQNNNTNNYEKTKTVAVPVAGIGGIQPPAA